MDGFARADHLAEVADFTVQHIPVKKEQRRQGLVLRRDADFLFDRQMGELGVDLAFGHLGRMTEVVEKDETFDPMAIGLFGPAAVMAGAQGFPETI